MWRPDETIFVPFYLVFLYLTLVVFKHFCVVLCVLCVFVCVGVNRQEMVNYALERSKLNIQRRFGRNWRRVEVLGTSCKSGEKM